MTSILFLHIHMELKKCWKNQFLVWTVYPCKLWDHHISNSVCCTTLILNTPVFKSDFAAYKSHPWLGSLTYTRRYIIHSEKKIKIKNCILCRETFCTSSHLYKVQLLLKGMEGRNMSKEYGPSLLEMLINFSRRRNGNSGPYSICIFQLCREFHLKLNLTIKFSLAVKLAFLREQWLSDLVDLIYLGLSFWEAC